MEQRVHGRSCGEPCCADSPTRQAETCLPPCLPHCLPLLRRLAGFSSASMNTKPAFKDTSPSLHIVSVDCDERLAFQELVAWIERDAFGTCGSAASKSLNKVDHRQQHQHQHQQLNGLANGHTITSDEAKVSSTGPASEKEALFGEYLNTFSDIKLPRESRGTALGSKLSWEGKTWGWVDALLLVKVQKLAQRWRKTAAARGHTRRIVEQASRAAVNAELEAMYDWDTFDVFKVAELSQGRPLEVVTLALMNKLCLLEKLKLPRQRLASFLVSVESAYQQENPYHNAVHAADVVQAVAALIGTDDFSAKLTDLEVISLVLAAVVHDTGHPGVNNAFLVRSNSDPAYLYNDNSVNENYHLCTAFRLLAREENNFFANIPEEDWRFVRRLVIDVVLSTDMAFHTALLKQMSATVARLGPDIDQWEGESRALLLKFVLHACDISNPARPWAFCRQWGARITEENFQQGDRERSMGIPVSPLNDRNLANPVKSQQVFCDLFVKPTFEILGSFAPRLAQRALAHCDSNSMRYGELVACGQSSLPLE